MQARTHTRTLSSLAAAVVALLLITPWAMAADADEDAGAFIAKLNKQAVAQLNDPETSNEQKVERFLAMVERSFDVPTISKFVLGAYWRRASKAERAEFIDVFSKVNFQRFLPLFTQYANQTFSVTKVRPDDRNPRLFFVSSSISRGDAAPAQVDWRVLKRTEGFRIIDVVAEGVSMTLTLRNEYGSVARTAGVGGLITQLRKKADIDAEQLLQPVSAQ